jgi:hypothetical protein
MACFLVMDGPVTFDADFTPALLDDAARVFVHRYLARRYGVLLAAATALDIAGLAIGFWLGAGGAVRPSSSTQAIWCRTISVARFGCPNGCNGFSFRLRGDLASFF